MIEGFQSFIDYFQLRRHFNEINYIWTPNRKKTRFIESNFEKIRSIGFYRKLEWKFPNRDTRIEYLISSFLFDNTVWIGDVFKEEIEEFHINRLKRTSALESQFERDCERLEFYLIDNQLSLEKIILTKGINDPIIINVAKKIDLCWETLTLMDHFTNFMDLWFPIQPLKKQRRILLCKYKYVLRIPERNYEKLQKTFNNIAQIK